MGDRLKVQAELILNTWCVCVYVCVLCVYMHVLVRVYTCFSLQGKGIVLYLRDGDLFQGHIESKEILGALCSYLGLQEPGMRFPAV